MLHNLHIFARCLFPFNTVKCYTLFICIMTYNPMVLPHLESFMIHDCGVVTSNAAIKGSTVDRMRRTMNTIQ